MIYLNFNVFLVA